MENEKFSYCYEIEYASTIFAKRDNKKIRNIMSNDSYDIGDYLLISKEKQGIFIGKVIKKQNINIDNDGYSIEMKLDIEKFLIKEYNKNLKKKIQKEMDKKIAEIDADLKLQLYASQNAEFAELYEQYKTL